MNTTKTNTTFFILTLLLSFTPHLLSYTNNHHYRYHRHLLHQPLFPETAFPPTQPPSLSPQPQPEPQQHQPKYPFSSSTPTATITTTQTPPFFPFYPSPPPPPTPPSSSSIATFPANISALIFPDSSSKKPISPKFLAVVISVSVLASVLIGAAILFLYYRKRRNVGHSKIPRPDSVRLYPSNTPSSDCGPNPTPAPVPTLAPVPTPSNSSEFLYLGTLVNSRGTDNKNVANSSNVSASSPYTKLGSPELRPLPPLPRQNPYTSGEMGTSTMDSTDDGGADDNDTDGDEEEFFSPRGSYSEKDGLHRSLSSSQRVLRVVETEDSPNSSYPSSNSVSVISSLTSSPSMLLNLKPRTFKPPVLGSGVDYPAPSRPAPPPPPILGSGVNYPAPSRRAPPPPPPPQPKTPSPPQQKPPIKLPPPPPPAPPPRYWESSVTPTTFHRPASGPPSFITPSRPITFQNVANGLLSNQNAETMNVETPRPKLKPLHWDKVRASSDRAMVWDQLKSSSFQLNEEMIETLFKVNASNLNVNDKGRYSILPPPNQENQVLDPKKSQNIAILLRALNVTVDEVCEALLEGNTDTLGAELLESLLKMAPTIEEERKLKEFNDASPLKLGPAEKFLKVVLDIPSAFKRADAMLYIANFDSEVEYLQRSFETLEAACKELRNSRMFQKLLEAVLKTGNRMNIGTNRGDAHAFKLDTLLKLVDVRGTDGKTTLLHFVVQEIIKAEGFRVLTANQDPPMEQSYQSSFHSEVELRKLGLQTVSCLSGELTNVKKSAAMDFEVISNEVLKLANGVTKIKQVIKLDEEPISKNSSTGKFFHSMNEFLSKAEEKITKIEAHEKIALSLVKEITEYFHGNSATQDAHPFRTFMVVRDFLSVLDQVCKEVGKINERTVINSARQFPLTVNSTPVLPVFPVYNEKLLSESSEDESSTSSS